MGLTFRANVPQVRSLRKKNSLSELVRGFRGNGPRRAGQDLCSTRAGGQDDGSLQNKLPQILLAECGTNLQRHWIRAELLLQIALNIC